MSTVLKTTCVDLVSTDSDEMLKLMHLGVQRLSLRRDPFHSRGVLGVRLHARQVALVEVDDNRLGGKETPDFRELYAEGK